MELLICFTVDVHCWSVQGREEPEGGRCLERISFHAPRILCTADEIFFLLAVVYE